MHDFMRENKTFSLKIYKFLLEKTRIVSKKVNADIKESRKKL